MKEFHLEIVTPDGLAYEGMIESLLVNTSEGTVEFLAGHIDYVTALGIGKIRIRENGRDRFASVSGGFVTVSQSEVKLVAITFEFAENIDIDRAKLAKQRATDVIATSKDSKAVEIAKLKLQRALSRIKVYELK
ncbi:MAG: ATP synthase F1 subunit epsilon [Clostridia bacterium]|nr:ATP synthase F1 subunit epsilon [Clostridia bacterium]